MPKDLRYLCKRRKNQLINYELHAHKDASLSHSIASNIACNAVNETISTVPLDSIYNSNALPTDLNEINELLESQSHIESDTEYNIELQNNSPALTYTSDYGNENNLREDLQAFVVKHNVTHNVVNELLQILRKHGHTELPSDVRVLVGTSRNASIDIKPLGNGRYKHFGLLPGLERCINIYSDFLKSNEIKLNVNIDGLPISKSSGSQFWPIMASIEEIEIYTLPFIIGMYHGMRKPSNANEFLTDFVNECILVYQHGITVCNRTYTVAINAILCDAPARSFITYTKGHTGYFSCSRCVQEGDFLRNRVTFPEVNCPLRTNDTFKNRAQLEHHTGDSILETLPIGMVSHIPLDYMHLVCLGVVKRLLQLWIRGSKNIRLSTEDINLVSHHLISIRSCIPSEFARKPRSLQDVDKWKATEFRQFLLYTGIVVMKSVMPRIYYNHFLSLSIAIRILTDSELCVTFNAYANSLLAWFVSNYGDIYGDEYLSYNVHNLIHLANDVANFGCLDNISCFKYENHMQKIKKKIHQSGKPLQELSNRISEELQIPIQPCRIVQYPIIVYKKRSNDKEISYLQFQTFKIAINANDNCILLDDDSVLFIVHIFEHNHLLYINAQRFLNPQSFFAVPCDSKRLGIFILSNTTTSDIITVPVTRIKRKCLKLKYLHEVDSYVTIPLQHVNH